MNDMSAHRPVAEPARRRVGDIEIAFDEAGPPEGELLILLHGFPEYRGAWRRHLAALADAGFHVVAPDQRGYGLTGKPQGVSAYDLDRLAEDVLGLAGALGASRFRLVGHDWGASVAWWIASRHPQALERMAVINAPHPAIWLEAMRGDARQRLKSLYVQFLRLRSLPELLIRAGGYRGLEQALASARLDRAELDGYRRAWREPGALTGMINWYRALLARPMPAASSFRVKTPTLIIWGDRDAFAVPELAERSAGLCARAQVVHLPDATHWAHHEERERVDALLIDFLKAPAPQPR